MQKLFILSKSTDMTENNIWREDMKWEELLTQPRNYNRIDSRGIGFFILSSSHNRHGKLKPFIQERKTYLLFWQRHQNTILFKGGIYSVRRHNKKSH